MAEKHFRVSYDREENMFSIFKDGSRSKFSFDLELPNGDIIIDFDSNGYIVGLEFFNASQYLPVLKGAKEGKIKAKMSVQYGRNWALIFYEVSVAGKKAISSQIISPYSRKLVVSH